MLERKNRRLYMIMINMEELILHDHLVRKIREHINFIYEEAGLYYSKTGQPPTVRL
jgi:hypothetical protein